VEATATVLFRYEANFQVQMLHSTEMVYLGVILTTAGNPSISTLADVADKRIGINDLSTIADYIAQYQELDKAGVNLMTDVKQVNDRHAAVPSNCCLIHKTRYCLHHCCLHLIMLAWQLKFNVDPTQLWQMLLDDQVDVILMSTKNYESELAFVPSLDTC
jgi:ABC-type amino acid transport substrate-binding protein